MKINMLDAPKIELNITRHFIISMAYILKIDLSHIHRVFYNRFFFNRLSKIFLESRTSSNLKHILKKYNLKIYHSNREFFNSFQDLVLEYVKIQNLNNYIAQILVNDLFSSLEKFQYNGELSFADFSFLEIQLEAMGLYQVAEKVRSIADYTYKSIIIKNISSLIFYIKYFGSNYPIELYYNYCNNPIMKKVINSKAIVVYNKIYGFKHINSYSKFLIAGPDHISFSTEEYSNFQKVILTKPNDSTLSNIITRLNSLEDLSVSYASYYEYDNLVQKYRNLPVQVNLSGISSFRIISKFRTKLKIILHPNRSKISHDNNVFYSLLFNGNPHQILRILLNKLYSEDNTAFYIDGVNFYSKFELYPKNFGFFQAKNSNSLNKVNYSFKTTTFSDDYDNYIFKVHNSWHSLLANYRQIKLLYGLGIVEPLGETKNLLDLSNFEYAKLLESRWNL